MIKEDMYFIQNFNPIINPKINELNSKISDSKKNIKKLMAT